MSGDGWEDRPSPPSDYRSEYQPPAYRAAKCYHDAGKAEEAPDWAKKAKARLEEIAAKEHPLMLRKVLRTSKEEVAKRIEECKVWAGE